MQEGKEDSSLEWLLRWALLVGLGWREGQTRSVVQHIAFVRAEMAFVCVGVDHALASFWRHGTESLHRVANRLTTVGWELLHLIVKLPRLLLLCRCEMFPDFHAAQHAILLLRRHAVEVLQAILQLLLALRW